jgi:hypothetical protein
MALSPQDRRHRDWLDAIIFAAAPRHNASQFGPRCTGFVSDTTLVCGLKPSKA